MPVAPDPPVAPPSALPSRSPDRPERPASEMASSNLPPAAAFYVPSLPTLDTPLNAHPTHPLNVWAGLLPSGDPTGASPNAGGEDVGQKDDKILCVSCSRPVCCSAALMR